MYDDELMRRLFSRPFVLETLEFILAKETINLCPIEKLIKISSKKEKFTKSQLEEMLIGSKEFINLRFKTNCDIPKIGYFSVFDTAKPSDKILKSYALGAANAVMSSALLSQWPIILGSSLGISALLFGYGYYKQRANRANSFNYNDIDNKITISPMSKFMIQGCITHEYVHHALYRMNITGLYIHEGFARNMELEFNKHLARKQNDERYLFYSQWQSCLELYAVYLWNCQQNNRLAYGFLGDLTKLKTSMDGYHAYGNAFIRICEEFGCIDYNDCNPIKVLGSIKQEFSRKDY